MSKFVNSYLCVFGLLLLLSGNSYAELHGRLPETPGGTDYQAYYDDQLDVTWYYHPNLIKLLGIHGQGESDYPTAKNAVDSLSVNGITGWRLPYANKDGNDDFVKCHLLNVTQQECKDSELAHLFWYGTGSEQGVTGINRENPGPFFPDIRAEYFWSDTYCPDNPNQDPETCRAIIGYGNLGHALTNVLSDRPHTWPVISGDVDTLSTEDCSNGVDDDGDGLIDSADPDCGIPTEQPDHVYDLNVRCVHEPLYPQLGDTVTITARAIDSMGDIVVPDFAEIYLGALDSPVTVVAGQGAIHTFQVTEEQFGYACRVGEGALEAVSWAALDERLRFVEVGSPESPSWKAIPVYYNGEIDSRVDIVFFHDKDEYTGFDDPLFLADVQLLIEEGYFTVPWFVQYQWAFNFWIATADDANSGPDSGGRCMRQSPENINEDYAFRDSGAIVHRAVCRDNASSSEKMFTMEMDPNRFQVVAHETGHSPFGMADEYCVLKDGDVFCDGGYFTSGTAGGTYEPPFPNLFSTESACQLAAQDPLLYFEPGDCRALPESIRDMNTWWIGEPELRIGIGSLVQIRDLMQQTGKRMEGGAARDRYKVGNSEVNRMNWFVFSKCLLDEEC